MKKGLLMLTAVVAMLIISPACKKGGGGGCSETAIQVTTTPAINTVDPPAPGPDFPIQVAITAGMPSGGVTIDIKAAPESPANAAAFFTSSTPSSSTNNNFTITGTPTATSCVVTVTVTSKSCNTNKFTGTYRYSRK